MGKWPVAPLGPPRSSSDTPHRASGGDAGDGPTSSAKDAATPAATVILQVTESWPDLKRVERANGRRSARRVPDGRPRLDVGGGRARRSHRPPQPRGPSPLAGPCSRVRCSRQSSLSAFASKCKPAKNKNIEKSNATGIHHHGASARGPLPRPHLRVSGRRGKDWTDAAGRKKPNSRAG
jgi:hypothetical protein